MPRSMTKRTLPLIASVVISAVLFAIVTHACSAFSSMQTVVQTPCDHKTTQSETPVQPENNDCDFIRYGMLSIKACSAEPEFSKIYSTVHLAVISCDLSLTGVTPSSWRSQAAPLELPTSPHRSYVVLRI